MCDDRDETERLDYYTNSAVDELRGHVKSLDNMEERQQFVNDADMWIGECADSTTPVMNYTLLRIAANDNEVALREPDIGPAFDGTPTPINIIAANIYELLNEALYEELESIKNELEECADHLMEDHIKCEKSGDYCPVEDYGYE